MAATTDDYGSYGGTRMSGWVGWIIFAAAVMIVAGVFDVIWGITAIVRDEVFVSGPRGNVINLDYTTWGWINLVIGVGVVVAGLALFSGSIIASVVAITMAVISAISNLLSISAYPIWSVMVIAMNIFIIYAIAMHGNELRENY
jgi:hypothetical protein